MSSVTVSVEGDLNNLLTKLKNLSDVKKQSALNAVAEGLRTSTVERFHSQRDPDDKPWEQSIRAIGTGGKTLIETATLMTSIRAEADSSGATVGTNDIRAATHQFGAERTIRAKRDKYLTFKVGGKWRRVESVRVNIPARPFLGISEEDQLDIKEIIEAAVEEAVR